MRSRGPVGPVAAPRPVSPASRSTSSWSGEGTCAPARGWARLLRIAVLGGSSLVLATAAHLAGGGHLPGAPVILVLLLAAGVVAAAVTAARCRLPVLVVVLAVEQLSLHAVLAAGSTTPDPLHPMPGGHDEMAAHAAVEMVGAQPEPLLMVGAHLLATLVTAWLLVRGEDWLWRLADRVVEAAAALAPWPAAPPQARFPALMVVTGGTVPGRHASPRGPPALRVARS